MAARSQVTSEADPLPVDRPSGPGRSGAARKPPQRVQSGPLKHKHAYGGSSAQHLPMKTASPVTSSVGGSQRAAGAARAAHKVSGAGGKSKLHFSEVRGDLFSCPATASLAHCVSEDMAMGKGIATVFKKRFGGVRELKEQGWFHIIVIIIIIIIIHYCSVHNCLYIAHTSIYPLDIFSPGAKTGGLAVLEREERYIYYLVKFLIIIIIA